MSVRYDLIAAVMRSMAVLEEDYQAVESFPDPWYVQLAIDTQPRYDLLQRGEYMGGVGMGNWTKWDHTEHLRFRAHDQLEGPVNHETLKGRPMKHPQLVPGDQPAATPLGGTYYWKLQL